MGNVRHPLIPHVRVEVVHGDGRNARLALVSACERHVGAKAIVVLALFTVFEEQQELAIVDECLPAQVPVLVFL